jgi:uncharacterized protein YacL
MFFLRNERFKEQVKRTNLERYVNLSITFSICSAILVGFALFFAITSQFSEQKTVFYFLVILFVLMFLAFVMISLHFHRKLKHKEEILRFRANNLSSIMIRNINQQSVFNEFASSGYNLQLEMQSSGINKNKKRSFDNKPSSNNSNNSNNNNKQFTKY